MALLFVFASAHAAAPSKDQPPFSIVAENGRFTPDNLSIAHLDPRPISIFAKDRDYDFHMKKFGRHHTIKKGTHAEFPVSDLGDGVYPFTCGKGCGGKITIFVAPDSDPDDLIH